MASILDRYGIKEVADVTFYEIGPSGAPTVPVLYLDTLKVSTIEQTAETTDARGGKGNPKLVSWDYGKEINVTLEDALFSAKSMSIMFGNSKVNAMAKDTIDRIAVVRTDEKGKLPDYFVADHYTAGGSVRQKIWMGDPQKKTADAVEYKDVVGMKVLGLYTEQSDLKNLAEGTTKAVFSNDLSAVAGASGEWAQVPAFGVYEKVFIKYRLSVNATTITISGDSFPGTYYITGDTYARSDITGDDQFFQFIIPKAKVTSENTITLEAEGDPSVFNMNLTVLRPEDGDMMKLVQYVLTDDAVTVPETIPGVDG